MQTAPEGMENADKTGSKALSFAEFAKHIKDNVTNSMKETVKQRTVSAKKDTKFFGDGKNAMSMNALDNFERHRSGTLDRIEVSA